MTRLDAEGVGRVDVEVQSHPRWRRFVSKLPAGDKALLNVWRGGAVYTPTRRFAFRGPGSSACPKCKDPLASARHFWAFCPALARERDALSREFGVPQAWWGLQPRVTAKTGWITLDAAPTAARRADLQVMAARMGLHVVRFGPEVSKRSGVADVAA